MAVRVIAFNMRSFRFSPALPQTPAFTVGDGFIVLGIVALLYAGARLALRTPAIIVGPSISLSYRALAWYTLFSVGRMTIAYGLSLLFSLTYGYTAARNGTAERVLMPLLDVLQSVPILSFLPVVLLSLNAVLPQNIAAEVAAIVLIFTSQAWNMTFSFYQSMTTLPDELREAATIFRFSPWLRFNTLELPFAAPGLIWNSIMSWSGGWFFLMAAEIFTVGARDFRLPGLGSYLQTAANQGNLPAVFAGLAALVLVIIALEQFVWRPVLAWADKFKLEMTQGDEPPTSWFLNLLSRSWLVQQFNIRVQQPVAELLDGRMRSETSSGPMAARPQAAWRPSPLVVGIGIGLGLAWLFGTYRAAALLLAVPSGTWAQLGIGLLATFARVTVSLIIALAWTVPLGVVIGTNRKLAAVLQPIVQVAASIPATALFPLMLLALLPLPGGLNVVAVLLMLMGTQWYLLFNIIAGAAAIPQDLRYTTDLLRLSRLDRWRTLILPAIFPYLITGAITASGGAWNASVVAEHEEFAGQTHAVLGIGAVISEATGSGNYALLLAATLVLVAAVVLINRTFWRWLYRLAEERFRME